MGEQIAGIRLAHQPVTQEACAVKLFVYCLHFCSGMKILNLLIGLVVLKKLNSSTSKVF
jgi:hypothetical protein